MISEKATSQELRIDKLILTVRFMSIHFSRRKLLVGGSAALIASVAQTTAKANQVDRQILTVSGKDPDFAVAVEELYPGLLANSYFQVISPLALLITHKSGPGVRAFSVSWSTTTSTGTYTTAQFYYHAPGSYLKHKSVSTLGSARMDLLQIGDSVLVAPFFNWTPSWYRNNPNPDWKKLVADVEPGDFLVSQLNSATAVNVVLDCTIFSDWKKTGPNQYHFARRLTMRRNAEHDEGLAVYRMLKAGAPDSAVIETLTQHATAPRSSAARPAKRFYDQCRRFQAQVLLRHFQDADRDVFIKALHRLVTQKRTDITKIVA